MHNTDAIQEPSILCYQLPYYILYDPEVIWSLVQRHGGTITALPGGHYDYYIASEYASILLVAFPELRRQLQKDLYL
jgi:hypothetical protein